MQIYKHFSAIKTVSFKLKSDGKHKLSQQNENKVFKRKWPVKFVTD